MTGAVGLANGRETRRRSSGILRASFCAAAGASDLLRFAGEQMFEASFNAALDQYRKLLSEVDAGQPHIPNDNFDTGSVTGPGKYWLNDVTQAQLLDALAKQNFNGASPELRAELLEFFADPNAPYAIKSKKKEWARVQAEIAQLRQETPRTVAADARKLLNSNSMEVPF